ncbi:MAG: DUF6919 domain-containing protein [Rhodothermales bacterium]
MDDLLNEAREAWSAARSFQDLCGLIASFIEGNLPYMPGYSGSEVDEETNSIAPYLAVLNRSGFLTIRSQPGQNEPDWKQRAFVDGYALEPVARYLSTLTLSTDLLVVTAPPGVEVGYRLPVILRDFQPHGWAGSTSFDELSVFAEDCSTSALAELQQAWSVSVVDLAWGRERHIWEELTKALAYSEKPHPDLVLCQR